MPARPQASQPHEQGGADVALPRELWLFSGGKKDSPQLTCSHVSLARTRSCLFLTLLQAEKSKIKAPGKRRRPQQESSIRHGRVGPAPRRKDASANTNHRIPARRIQITRSSQQTRKSISRIRKGANPTREGCTLRTRLPPKDPPLKTNALGIGGFNIWIWGGGAQTFITHQRGFDLFRFLLCCLARCVSCSSAESNLRAKHAAGLFPGRRLETLPREAGPAHCPLEPKLYPLPNRSLLSQMCHMVHSGLLAAQEFRTRTAHKGILTAR